MLNRDVAMSTLNIQIFREPVTNVVAWTPWRNFSNTYHEVLNGLKNYVDIIASLLLWLPLALLWIFTTLAVVFCTVKSGHWIWRKYGAVDILAVPMKIDIGRTDQSDAGKV